MRKSTRGTAWRSIESLFDAGVATGLTDGQLLRRFHDNDLGPESNGRAFAALVERHGPMVLRVCRAITGDDHDAQDAFQATFLVLVRRSGSLWVRDSIGPWLLAVARKVATRARNDSARRRVRERQAAREAPEESSTDGDLASVVHEEVDRLPPGYRAAVILCALEGLTCEEAARQLGWPAGTVRSRLARGKARLRARLARRGYAPSIAAGLSGAIRPVPATLVSRTIRGATEALIDPRAVVLARGVVRITSLTAWRWAGSTVVAFIALVALRSTSTAPAGAADPPKNAKPVATRKADDPPQFHLTGQTTYDESTIYKLRTRTDARVEKVLVGLGQRVKVGEPIAELYSTDLAASKNDFQTKWVQWQHDLKLYELRQKLVETGAISQQAWVDTQNNEQKSRLDSNLAKDKLAVYYELDRDEIHALLDPLRRDGRPGDFGDDRAKARTTLRSKAEGLVIGLDLVPGNFYSASETLGRVAQTERMWVYTHLSRDAALLLRARQTCRVEVPFLDPALFGILEAVTVSETNPDQNATLRISVPNPDGRLKANMLVKVTIDVLGPETLRPAVNKSTELDGEWITVRLTRDGKDAPAELVDGRLWSVRDGVGVAKDVLDGVEQISEYSTITLDPSRNPKQIDQTYLLPGGGSHTNRGIYRLEGDRLTICVGSGRKTASGQRPDRFESGDGYQLTVMERVRRDAARQPPSK